MKQREIKQGLKPEMKLGDGRPESELLAPELKGDSILTVEEVAQFLKVPMSWVYEHTRPRCRDPLPFFKVGKYKRFSTADILSYLDSTRSRNHRWS